MERLLADRLALNIGDLFKLGTATFQLADVITYIPDGAGDGFGLEPRTIVMTKDLENSGLLASGTLFSTKYRMTLPSGTNLDTLASTVEPNWPQAAYAGVMHERHHQALQSSLTDWGRF